MPRSHQNLLGGVLLIAIALAFTVSPSLAAKKKKKTKPTNSEDLVERIDQALETKVSIILKEASVSDIALLMKMQVGVPVLVDRQALDDVGLDAEAKLINGGYKNVSLRCMLLFALKEIELTWLVKDGALVITTPEVAEAHLITEVYPVADLLRARGNPWFGEHDFDSLITMLTSTIAPHFWDEVGGPGSIRPFRDTLTISQSQDVHRTIRLALAAIRRARRLAENHQAAAPPIHSTGLHDAESARITKALSQSTKCEFVDTRLADVAAWIQKNHRVPVLMDVTAMDQIGIGIDVPVTLSLERVTLKQALGHLLTPIDMTWIIREGALVLTTEEEAENHLQLRAYPIADLIARQETSIDDFSVEPIAMTADDLADTLQAVIAPETWDMMGGMASSPAHPYIDVLLVSQTAQIHEQIEQYFIHLREKLGLMKPAPNPFKKQPDNPFAVHDDSDRDRDNPFGLGADPFADDHDAGKKPKNRAERDPFGGTDEPPSQADPFADPPSSEAGVNEPFGGPADGDPFADSAHGASRDDNPFGNAAESPAGADPFASDGASAESSDKKNSDNPFGDASSSQSTKPGNGKQSPAAVVIEHTDRGAKMKRSASKRNKRARPNEKLRFVVYFMRGTLSGNFGCGSRIPVVGSTDGFGGTTLDNPPRTLHQFGGNATPPPRQAAAPPDLDEDELLEIIQELVAPETWDSQEGVYARVFGNRILIRHNDATHGQIHGLLRRMRVVFHSSLNSNQWSSSGSGWVGGMSGGLFSIDAAK